MLYLCRNAVEQILALPRTIAYQAVPDMSRTEPAAQEDHHQQAINPTHQLGTPEQRDVEARIRTIARKFIEIWIRDLKALETELYQNIFAAKQDANEKLRGGNPQAAILSMQQARNYHMQAETVSHYLERLVQQLHNIVVSCAEPPSDRTVLCQDLPQQGHHANQLVVDQLEYLTFDSSREMTIAFVDHDDDGSVDNDYQCSVQTIRERQLLASVQESYQHHAAMIYR